MNVPEEFDFLTRCFWNGSLEEAPSLESWIARAVSLLDDRKRRIARDFLDDVLSRNLSHAELHEIWSGGGASYMITDRQDLVKFLGMVRYGLHRRP